MLRETVVLIHFPPPPPPHPPHGAASSAAPGCHRLRRCKRRARGTPMAFTVIGSKLRLSKSNCRIGSFDTICGAVQEGDSIVVHCTETLKTRRGTDRFSGPALALNGIYFRGNAIRTLFDGLVMQNHEVGSFEAIYGAVQEGDSAVVHCTKTLKNKARHRSL